MEVHEYGCSSLRLSMNGNMGSTADDAGAVSGQGAEREGSAREEDSQRKVEGADMVDLLDYLMHAEYIYPHPQRRNRSMGWRNRSHVT